MYLSDAWEKFWTWALNLAEQDAKNVPIIKTTPYSNRNAFLQVIAVSEGTIRIPDSDNGYRALFGSGTFSSYADHPRQEFTIPRLGIKTTAAGRYQILAHIYDFYKASLKLPDFSPASQDRIAIELIIECHALDDVDAGRLSAAISKCSSRWASFAGNHYGQPITPIGVLMAAYSGAGGQYNTINTPTDA